MAKKYFELLNVDHDKDSISEALGITEERLVLLKKEMYYAFHEQEKSCVTTRITYLLQFCESLEEVIYITFLIGVNEAERKRNFANILPVPSSFLPPELKSMIADIIRRIEEGDDSRE